MFHQNYISNAVKSADSKWLSASGSLSIPMTND